MTFKRTRWAAVVVAAALGMVACGGDGGEGGSGTRFNRLVAFGDSYSDVGTYNVGTIGMIGAQTGGAGRWTVNALQGGQVWVEQLASQLGLPTACAAETGLLPNNPLLTGAPVTRHPGCTVYAQGSARVTSDQGSNSVGRQRQGEVNIGYLARPVKDQMALHLSANGGRYAGDELITVWAGTNDVFMELSLTAPGSAQNAIDNVALAGRQLGELIRTEVVGKGARRVLVLNVPFVAGLPYAQALGPDSAALVDAMTRAFNDQLAQALRGVPEVRLADAYGLMADMIGQPGKYRLSNVTDVACGPNAFSPAATVNGTAVACNASNLLPGDRSRYLLADAVHPTPYAHSLFSDFAIEQMRAAGWD